MNKSLTITTLAVCALLAVPASLAAPWMSYGEAEPNTVLDSTSYMWADQPGTNVRIYFNGYASIGTTTMNPNVAALGTKIESVAAEQQFAVLGVWTDCNGDGYIGNIETSMREYPSQLLLDAGLCPAITGSTNCWGPLTGSPPRCPSWPATGFNNYNGWVTELIPIGDDATTSGDRRVIKDLDAAVWGDFGRPNDPAGAAGGTCPINPQSRGTTQSTGGLLTRADCQADVLGRWNTVVDAAGDPAGLRFADENDGNSGTLGQQETLGDDDSNKAIVQVQDCSQAPLVPFVAPDGEPGQGIRAPGTNVNTDGTVAGTVNYTFEALPLPTRQSSDDVGPASTSNCDGTDDRGEEPYSLIEGDFNGVSNARKTEAQWNFGFQTMSRGGLPLGGLTGAAGGPSDAGVEAVSGCTACQNSEWFGGSTQVSKLPRTVATRGTVGQDDFNADIAGGYWLTYYAVVGPTSTGTGAALPGSPAGAKYGQAQCGSFTSGVHNDWECDPALWNLSPAGVPLPDPNGAFAYPGKIYNLRDVDCYDGAIGETGVGVLPAFFGAEPCRNG